MNLKTVRWQLPLSYAGIALLAALSLGTVLLAVLRDYYTQRERDYLVYTAKSIESSLAPMFFAGLPQPILQAQVDILAVAFQTRVEILDPGEKVIFDSGREGPRDVLAFSPLSIPPQKLIVTKNAGEAGAQFITRQDLAFGPVSSEFNTPAFKGIIVYQTAPISSTQELSSTTPITTAASVPTSFGLLTSIPFALSVNRGFAVGTELENTGERSDLTFDLPLKDMLGQTLGTLHLSGGPAYGRSIVKQVAEAWAIAGGLAVLLAVAAGWFASRRVTAPLDALTAVTMQMAGGDLAARAPAGSPDEFGLLGSSFNEMAGRIEETVAALRRFVSDAAHELQTPLTALRTNLELAASESGTPAQAARMDHALEDVQRLSRLAAGLLDLSRLESGSNGGDFAPLDLAALSAAASESYASQAEQAGQILLLQLPENPVIVEGNPLQLQRAIGNLLENALKFTQPGGTIRLNLESGIHEAQLFVQDTGIGIPEEDLGQLFNRFHRGRNAAAYPGSGLGLAIVRAILQAHRGKVWAEALPEGGSRFSVVIPLAES